MNTLGSEVMGQAALWLLVLVPAVVGAVLALTRAERIAPLVSVTTAAVTLLLAALVAVARPAVAVPFLAGIPFGLEVDALSALVIPMITTVTLLVLVFSAGDIHSSRSRFHGLMLLFSSSAVLTATATTLPALLLAWEIMGATSYALIGFWWRDERGVSAGLTAFISTRAGDLGLYLASGAALAGGAGLALADLSDASEGWLSLIAAGVLVAAFGKAAQLPFSFWLSRAMEGPSAVSALLHSAAMVAMGGYLLLRLAPLLQSTGWADTTAAWVGAATALLLGAVAVAQRDLKQLLAASTAAQLGFVVMAAGLATLSGGAVHLVAHASTKAALFLAAGAWLTALGTKQLRGLLGVARRWPALGWSAAIAALALAGVPPLSLWLTKDAILAVALEESAALYAVALAASALSAAYAAKIVFAIWRTSGPEVESHDDGNEVGTRTVSNLQRLPVVVLAGGAALLGVLALPPVLNAISLWFGEGPGSPVHLLELIVSAALAIVVIVAVFRWGTPEPRWALSWLGLESIVHALVVRPTLRLSRALARFDDRVLDRLVLATPAVASRLATASARLDDRGLDRAVDSTAPVTLSAAKSAGRVDDRSVDGAVEALARGVRQIGRIARLPQTGQLHQYYAQAVALFAVIVVLLIIVVR